MQAVNGLEVFEPAVMIFLYFSHTRMLLYTFVNISNSYLVGQEDLMLA